MKCASAAADAQLEGGGERPRHAWDGRAGCLNGRHARLRRPGPAAGLAERAGLPVQAGALLKKPRMHNWTTFATVIYTALGRVRWIKQKLHFV